MKNRRPTSEYVLRALSFTLGQVILVICIGLSIAFAFSVGRDYMNINVLIKDGLYRRACVITMGDDSGVVSKVFTHAFLEKDAQLYSDVYEKYVIRSINHQTFTEFVVVLPWQSEVQVTAVERVPIINGELPAELLQPGEEPTPPEWQDGKYEITLVKVEGNWKIDKMELIEKLDKPAVLTQPEETNGQ